MTSFSYSARRLLGLFCAAGLTLFLSTDPTAAGVKRVDTVGKWGVYVLHADVDGLFIRCMTAQGDDFDWMGFGIDDRGTFEIWIGNESWDLVVGSESQVSYSIDKEPHVFDTFIASSRSSGLIATENPDIEFPKFARGRHIYINAEQAVLSHTLEGSSVALTALRQCWRQYAGDDVTGDSSAADQSGARAKRNPFAGSLD